MPNGLHDLLSEPETRHGQQLEYSIRLMSDIAAAYDATIDRNEVLCAQAMLDAFYVHLRLLAEFLVRTTDRRDFGPAQFGIAWTVPATAEAKRLAQHWDNASAYVVHFGERRVPKKIEDLEIFRVSGESFRKMAADALMVFAEFMRQLEQVTPTWSGGARIPDQVAEPNEWRTRVLSDRTSQLRAAFVESCDKVGLNGNQLLGAPHASP